MDDHHSEYSIGAPSLFVQSSPEVEADSYTGSDDGFEDSADISAPVTMSQKANSDGAHSLSTKSMTDSVMTFQKENGRTYHGYRAGTYHFPNDPTEADRLDFQYCVIQQATHNVLHFAPVPESANILDIGTGTGIWAVQMGDSFPDATVEATDLSPIQPSAVPENVQFIIDDAEQEDWAVPENHYDYIHTRILMGCFTDFKQIVTRGFKYTKPGGWMESSDVYHTPQCDDGTMAPDWPFMKWTTAIDEASMTLDRPLRTANKMKRWFIEAGFVDVQEKIVKLPINTWPRDREYKKIGKWWYDNLVMGLQGFSLALLTRVMGWSKEEIEVFLADVRKGMKDRHVHAYHRYHIVWGRKPELGETDDLDVMPKAQCPSSGVAGQASRITT
ncbi:MAG: hypothetical protein M1818_003495 [Claussenomyces sp. TS43310]|nr:MAG: hypothetical protein M1818_003495 [Claussenomyces sp. TS43310]